MSSLLVSLKFIFAVPCIAVPFLIPPPRHPRSDELVHGGLLFIRSHFFIPPRTAQSVDPEQVAAFLKPGGGVVELTAEPPLELKTMGLLGA